MSDATPPAGGGPAGPPPPPKLVLYGRPGCHLCEDALALVNAVARRVDFILEQVDIESDDELFKRYLERIPVLSIDGRELFELFVDAPALENALLAASAGAGAGSPHSRVRGS